MIFDILGSEKDKSKLKELKDKIKEAIELDTNAESSKLMRQSLECIVALQNTIIDMTTSMKEDYSTKFIPKEEISVLGRVLIRQNIVTKTRKAIDFSFGDDPEGWDKPLTEEELEHFMGCDVKLDYEI